MSFRIQAHGFDFVERAFMAGGRYLARPTDTMKDIELNMLSVMRATFAGQGRRYGGSWHKLSEPWAERKARMGWDPKILFGKPGTPLSQAYSREGAPHQFIENDGTSITIETDLEYAAVHQFGFDGGPRRPKIPARPYIDFNERDVHRWIDWLERDLGRAMRGAGGKRVT